MFMVNKFSILVQVFLMLFPWGIRRKGLNFLLKYKIHATARIGCSIVLTRHLVLDQYSNIGHLNVLRGLESVHISEYATIGRLNWIYGCSKESGLFGSTRERESSLEVGRHSAITSRHIIDCTDKVMIGCFSLIAGYRSLILTHSVNFEKNFQDCKPVEIGNYCFVGTSSVILGGSILPSYCVLGAMSLLNKKFSENYCFYAGVPASAIKKIPESLHFFSRKAGRID